MVSLLEDTVPAKPHLRLRHNVWSCIGLAPCGWVMGFGYTVDDAWADWRRRVVMWTQR